MKKIGEGGKGIVYKTRACVAWQQAEIFQEAKEQGYISRAVEIGPGFGERVVSL